MPPATLVRSQIESGLTPQEVLLALRAENRPFALVGRWAGGGAIVGSEPTHRVEDHEDPFAPFSESAPGGADDDAVGGGWFGHLSYGLGAAVESLLPPPPRPRPLPISSLAHYDHVLHRDAAGAWWFEGLDDGSNRKRLERREERLRAVLAASPRAPQAFGCGDFIASPGEVGYRRAVEACLAYIEAGDLYQANLALRLEAGFTGAGIDLFAAASAELGPAYGAYFDIGEAEIVSLSPELFLRRRGRRVRSAPIKGTIRRSDDPERALEQSRKLASSAKDRAENVMIVDLIRNDLGRVCGYGSVRATEATSPEAHPGLWHLVSEVEGDLYPGLSDRELLRATFPPGSVTGAPKIKAQDVISTLECTGREVYTGAIGFASPLAGLEMNVAIRTFEIVGGRIWLGAGAGIVADSDSAAEYEEAIAKAEPLVRAAGSRIVAPPGASRCDPGPMPIRAPRPDPGLGIIETLLVIDGVAIESERHIARMRDSALALYGVSLEESEIARQIDRCAPREGRSRVGIELIPGPGSPALRVEASSVATGPARASVRLEPITVPGGLGRHKWADRRLVDSIAAKGREALICDLDGAVLESGAGNVWIVEDGAIRTPPLDGRILPGATRRALIEMIGELGIGFFEEAISLERLRSADEVFLSSSVRGTRPAALDDRHTRAPARASAPAEVCGILSAALAERWGGADLNDRGHITHQRWWVM